MAQSPIFVIIKLLFNPDVSKKMILQMAFQQIKIIGVAKVLAAALGSATVGISSIIKIPQIKKILDPKSLEKRISIADGLSLKGLSLESISQLIHIAYNSQNNTSFINYGESLLIGLQNIALILLVEYYSLRSHLLSISNLSEQEQIQDSLNELKRPIGTILALIIFFTKLAPSSLINVLQVLNIPISIVSKIPQIQRNYTLKSTSSLSNITIFANVLGSAIRVFTTLKGSKKALQTKDHVLLAGYSSGLILNTVLAGQIVYYKKFFKADDESESESKKLE